MRSAWSPSMTWSRWPQRHSRQRLSLSSQVGAVTAHRAAGGGYRRGCLWVAEEQVTLTSGPAILPTVVPVGAAVTADETEVLKAEISKAVKQVQEEGERGSLPGKLVGPGPFLF